MNVRSWGYALSAATSSIRKNGPMSAASISTVAVSLLVLAIFLLLAVNLEHMATTLESQVEIRAYLASDWDRAKKVDLEARIGAIAGVREVTFVTREEALERLKQQFGPQQGLLEAVEEMNPLRDAFEVRVSQTDLVGPAAEEIGQLPGVEDVTYKQEIVERLFQLTRALRLAGLVLVLCLAAGTLFIISNTIRLTIFARRREVGIMKLVGATDSLIRWPFVLEGMILGLLGAALATLAAWLAYIRLVRAISLALPFLPVLPGQPLLRELAVLLLTLGAIIGAAGSALSLRRFLRV